MPTPYSTTAHGEKSGGIFTRFSSVKHKTVDSKPPPATTTAPLPSSTLLAPSKSRKGKSDLSPPRRTHRTASSRHSLSSSVTEIGASIRRSASLRSASARSPSSTTLNFTGTATPDSGSSSNPQSATSSRPPLTHSLSTFSRRKKSIESIKSLKLTSSPPDSSYPAFDLGTAAKPPMSAMSMTAVQLREQPRRPIGTSQSNLGFGEGGNSNFKGMMAGSAPVVPALPPGAASVASGPGGGLQNPSVSFTHIQETAAKRINTLDYLRKAYVPLYLQARLLLASWNRY